MRTHASFELLPVPHLLDQGAKGLQKGITEVLSQQEEFSEGLNGVEQVKDRIGVVCPIEIIEADDAGDELLAIDIVLCLEGV